MNFNNLILSALLLVFLSFVVVLSGCSSSGGTNETGATWETGTRDEALTEEYGTSMIEDGGSGIADDAIDGGGFYPEDDADEFRFGPEILTAGVLSDVLNLSEFENFLSQYNNFPTMESLQAVEQIDIQMDTLKWSDLIPPESGEEIKKLDIAL